MIMLKAVFGMSYNLRCQIGRKFQFDKKKEPLCIYNALYISIMRKTHSRIPSFVCLHNPHGDDISHVAEAYSWQSMCLSGVRRARVASFVSNFWHKQC